MDMQVAEEQEDILNDVPEIEQEEAPLSIRENLAAALEQSKSKQEDVAEKTEKSRDETGKFAKEPKLAKSTKGKEVVTDIAKIVPRGTQEIKNDIKLDPAPQGISAAVKAKWAELPPEVRQEFSKREADYHKELTKHDEERVFGRSVRDLANPYIPLIKAEGGDLVKAFGSYLNTAYILRTKSPQEKGQLILQLAREYGADLQGASQPQGNADPRYTQLQQEVGQLKSVIQQDQEAKKQQEEKVLKSQIEEFSADPSNIHFETVKAHMAALLRGGMATGLQDAYDQAVYANPQTRSTLLQQQSAVSDEKRLAEKKAKAEQAKRAGSSLRGAPGMAATKNGRIVQPDLRSELRAAFASHQGG